MNFRRHCEDVIEDALGILGRNEILFEITDHDEAAVGDLCVQFWIVFPEIAPARTACFPVLKHPFTDDEIRSMVQEAVHAIDANFFTRITQS